MQIVIEIDDNLYTRLFDNGDTDAVDMLKACVAIRKGISLPKGHGRILDEKDILDTENNDGGWYDLVDMPEYIAGVKPIVEADAESKDQYEARLKTDMMAVLDKIRAEIEQITDTMGVSYNQYVSKIDVLQIIDKYKAEKEESHGRTNQ